MQNEPEGALLAVGTVNNGLCIYFKRDTLFTTTTPSLSTRSFGQPSQSQPGMW